MEANKKVFCKTIDDICEKYFAGCDQLYKHISKERNKYHAVVSLLSDVRSTMDLLYRGARFDEYHFKHYNELINDLMSVLDQEGDLIKKCAVCGKEFENSQVSLRSDRVERCNDCEKVRRKAISDHHDEEYRAGNL